MKCLVERQVRIALNLSHLLRSPGCSDLRAQTSPGPHVISTALFECILHVEMHTIASNRG